MALKKKNSKAKRPAAKKKKGAYSKKKVREFGPWFNYNFFPDGTNDIPGRKRRVENHYKQRLRDHDDAENQHHVSDFTWTKITGTPVVYNLNWRISPPRRGGGGRDPAVPPPPPPPQM